MDNKRKQIFYKCGVTHIETLEKGQFVIYVEDGVSTVDDIK